MILAEQTVPKTQSGLSINLKAFSKSITQKGNAHLGLGQYDEAKECYESLRSLGEKSTADQYLKKLSDAQERDR